MSDQDKQRDQHEQAVCSNSLDAINRLFGTSFSVWEERTAGKKLIVSAEVTDSPTAAPSWQRSEVGESRNLEIDENLSQLLTSHIPEAYQTGQATVGPLNDQQLLIVIPFEFTVLRTAAVGVLPAIKETSSLYTSMAETAYRLVQQEYELDQRDYFLNELSHYMEESSWMRSLAKCFEFMEINQSIVEVMERVLPELQGLIHAESLVFLPPTRPERRRKLEQSPTADSIERLIAECEQSEDKRPRVENSYSDAEALQVGHHSMIVAPVQHRNVNHGYLVGINRKKQETFAPGAELALSEDEFGTVEASLVEASASILATHCRNVALFQANQKLTTGVIKAMGGTVDARDRYTKGHSDRVAAYSREIARELGFSEFDCEQIYLTGLLHDVGKIGTPDAVLNKAGKLTEEEFEIIKRHPRQGYDIIKHLDELAFAFEGVLHHHERMDGRGYPDGLAADKIPLFARVIAVADAYDAMTSSRSYRAGMPLDKAEKIVRENVGTQFDPAAAEAFFKALPRINAIASGEQPADEEIRPLAAPLSLPLPAITTGAAAPSV